MDLIKRTIKTEGEFRIEQEEFKTFSIEKQTLQPRHAYQYTVFNGKKRIVRVYDKTRAFEILDGILSKKR